MSKLAWVMLPLLLAALWVGVRAARGRPPSRLSMNVGFSVLLLAYVSTTAGLGIFWVANQHLPAFDWHYLFGYGTVALVAVHLAFNARVLWRYLRGARPAPADAPASVSRRALWAALGGAGLAGLGFAVGLRHGRTELVVDGARAAGEGTSALGVVEQFHAFSSHSRAGVVRHAPSTDWGDPPAAFKRHAQSALQALPAPASALPNGRLDVAALSSLLWHTAGISLMRGAIAFRCAPSSGALFATELYLVAREVDGLAPGVWHYAPREQALQRVADVVPDLGLRSDVQLVVIATAMFRRSGHKYRDRTYRYVLADLGHALENLCAAGDAMRLPVQLLAAFDESRAARAIGVDEADEGVLAIAVLGAGAPAAAPAGDTAAFAAAPLTPGRALGITDAIHRATSLRAAAARTPANARPASAASPSTAPRELPPPAAAAMPMLARIATRRSQRRYGPNRLPQSQLSALLDAAMRRNAARLSSAVRIGVISQAVEGLPLAAWRYDAGSHALHPLAPQSGDWRAATRRAALDQDVAGDAAAVFVLAIDRGAFAADTGGAGRGYRHAFLEAGCVGERLYLEATALGLGVCGIGAFYDDEVAALAGVDPAREWVAHLVAVGVPA